MKKIIFSLAIVVVVAAAVIGATSAYFSDTETSENNTFAAGTMDLNIDGGDVAVTTMTLTNKAPGDSGSESEVLKNVGSLDGELDVTMGTVGNYACTDSENGGANDGTEHCLSDAGVLGANTEMAMYVDADESNTWNAGDIGLKSDGNTYTTGALVYSTIDSYSGITWNPAVIAMATNEQYGFVIDWQIPNSVGNGTQGDALNFDITFILEQADND